MKRKCKLSKHNDERSVDPIQEMLKVINEFSNLNAQGFKENYRSIADKRLIYNSKWCRMKFVWNGWDSGSGNSISIYYGRLHAPNESVTMICDGEENHAWHGFENATHFLDGRSPIDSAKMNYLTPLTSKYYDEEYTQKFHRRQPEWLIKMHMEMWAYYGTRFFELFDLQNPQLWTNYRRFLKEIYDIKGRPSFIKPSMDKVC
jgi:hypothetical protein